MNETINRAFDALKVYHERNSEKRISQLFDQNADRFDQFSLELNTLLFDYSKNNVSDETMALLLALATAAKIAEQRNAMFAGEKINTTEDRAVQHMALRAPKAATLVIDDENIGAAVQGELAHMRAFAQRVRSGEFELTGGAVTDVVNIGIGGSDLGPVMVSKALSPYHDGPNVHYVSNIDGADLSAVIDRLNPATTLLIVVSKTFTTQETMVNAASARAWIVAHLGEAAVKAHFSAISTNLELTRSFGIKDAQTFGFWDWVGGRYSVWSAVGLSVMLAIGPDNFDKFLAGANAADNHFEKQPLAKNIPVIMALIGIWHRNICGYATQAILPYDQHLSRFPAYLQQLDMESNGKSVSQDGKKVSRASGPIIWGEPGTNGQHAFYQLLHQGTDIVPVDFFIAAVGHEPGLEEHHEILVSNALAQSQALMRGRSSRQVLEEMQEAGFSESSAHRLAPHRTFPGNRPSNTFIYKKLDPQTLGMLIAFYEHKIFVQGAIWGINSFDQWGVELGKSLAQKLLPRVKQQNEDDAIGGSTAGLLAAYHRFKN